MFLVNYCGRLKLFKISITTFEYECNRCIERRLVEMLIRFAVTLINFIMTVIDE